MSLAIQGALNRLAGTEGLGEQGAANAAISRISEIEADANRLAIAPTGAVAETFSRMGATTASVSPLTSGTLLLTAIYLRAGATITSASYHSATQAAVTPTNWWFALYDGALARLGQTADQTTTAWAANTLKTVAFASTITVPTTSLHYLGIMVAAGTVPSLMGVAQSGFVPLIVPKTNGTSTAALTTTAPATAAAIAATGSVPWAWVS